MLARNAPKHQTKALRCASHAYICMELTAISNGRNWKRQAGHFQKRRGRQKFHALRP